MIRLLLLFALSLHYLVGSAQITNTAVTDSTYNLFPNPAHNEFFVTTQGRVLYALIITTNGSKRYEYMNNEILSSQNQFGFGCSQVGCVGAFVVSNFICRIQRNNLETGLYYLVLFDELGHFYHTMIVFD